MEPSQWLTLAGILIALETTLIAAIWGFAWFLSRKFNNIYDKIQKTLDLMIAKLEVHESHDVKRFADISDNIWRLRIQHAASNKNVLQSVNDLVDPKNVI